MLHVTDVVPNSDDPRSFVEVVCIRKGDQRALSNPTVVRELKRQVNRLAGEKSSLGKNSQAAKLDAQKSVREAYGLGPKALEQALKAPLPPTSLLDRAEDAYYSDDYRSAASFAERYLKGSKPSVENQAHALKLLGNARIALDDFPSAAEALKQAYSLDSNDVQTGISLVIALTMVGQIQQAKNVAQQITSNKTIKLESDERFILSAAISRNDLLVAQDINPESMLIGEEGNPDPAEKAFALCYSAAMNVVSGHRETAVSLLSSAAKIELGTNETDQLARQSCLIAEGLVDLMNENVKIAQEKLQRAREMKLGPRFTQQLFQLSISQLTAYAFEQIGDYTQAEALYRETYDIAKRSFGGKSLNTFSTGYALAALLLHEGKPDAALAIANDLLKDPSLFVDQQIGFIRIKLLRDESLFLLGSTTVATNDLESIERTLLAMDPTDHDLLIETRLDLGAAYRLNGRYDKAAESYADVLSLLGSTAEDLPVRAKALTGLGDSYMRIGKLDDSATALDQAVRLSRTGAKKQDDPDVANALYYRARLAIQQGKFEAGIADYREALGIETRTLGKRAIETSQTEAELGEALQDLGKVGEALPLLSEADGVQKGAHGLSELTKFETHLALGWALFDAGSYEQAQAIADETEQLVSKSIATVGDDNDANKEQQLSSAIALSLQSGLRLRRLTLARLTLSKLRRLAEKSDNLNIQTGFWMSAAFVSLNSGEFDGALIWTEKIREKCNLGISQMANRCALALLVRGSAMFKKGRLAEAETTLSDALSEFERCAGSIHLDAVDALLALADIYRAHGKMKEEAEAIKKAYEIRKAALGEQNFLTKALAKRIAAGN
jgi:cytochrome c-type biogenesis protein CcmH/NrfG